jgi:hypothetical protein
MEKVGQVLFGEKKWESLDKNKRRDAETFVSHVYYGGDIFVTRDENFFKHENRLKEIAKEHYKCDIEILIPKDALSAAKEHLLKYTIDPLKG